MIPRWPWKPIAPLILVVLAVLFFPFTNLRSEEPAKRTGTFSSLFYHEEAGDLLGVELRIVPARNGYQGTFQMAQGGPGELILVRPEFKGNEITFGLMSSGGTPGLFKGTIADDGIRGTLIYFPQGEPTPYTGFGDSHLFLKRTCGYWDCPAKPK